ncbi:hypothetical protein A0J61_04399 [Choanephora cucurbitarum]|uniref:Uncharacterized protein n=1 Tax=Choanephora cucurbitarum TaxID=101091 RepID=A0A1C7NG68_9FUNG|nr:hypothetical protein A0J61_04399 [Choanephora cucurbitarum]
MTNLISLCRDVLHQNSIRKFSSLGAEQELANAMSIKCWLSHNIDISAINRYSLESAYKSLKNKLGINGLDFQEPKEVFGICPLPENGIANFDIQSNSINAVILKHDDLIILEIQDAAFLSIGLALRSKDSRYTTRKCSSKN